MTTAGTETVPGPLAAEPRIRCAVIGLTHTRYYEQIQADAARLG
jgi:hypothetical protein